jgi:hypothetical protein
VTLQPEAGDSGGSQPAAPAPRRRRRLGWGAMILALGLGLSGLAGSAVGVMHQLLPRQFTVAQQQQIITWEMTSRWRELPAGRIFPATVAYEISGAALDGSQGLVLRAHRLGISRQVGCAAGASAAAATVLTAGHCAAMLRATYLDSSGSLVVTVGVAVLRSTAAATAAAAKLRAVPGLAMAVRAVPVQGTPARAFRDPHRQLAFAGSAGPYVVMSVVGFADGRRHVALAADSYYYREMTSLASGLSLSTRRLIGAFPPAPTCPGAPGC